MQLDRIERGVGTLADMAKGLQEELDKQNPIIDDIDTQLNRVTTQLKNNNAKLKGLLTQVGSRRSEVRIPVCRESWWIAGSQMMWNARTSSIQRLPADALQPELLHRHHPVLRAAGYWSIPVHSSEEEVTTHHLRKESSAKAAHLRGISDDRCRQESRVCIRGCEG